MPELSAGPNKTRDGKGETLFQGVAWHSLSHLCYDVGPFLWAEYGLSLGCVVSCQPFEAINMNLLAYTYNTQGILRREVWPYFDAALRTSSGDSIHKNESTLQFDGATFVNDPLARGAYPPCYIHVLFAYL